MDEILYYCEYCSKPVCKKFGSGRFCSKSCACGWVSKNQSEEAKKRKVEKGKANLRHDVGCCKKGYWTEERRQQARAVWTEEKRQQLSEKHKETAEARSIQMQEIMNRQEIREKISNGVKKAMAEGRKKGWGNARNPKSEQYFREFLTNENIAFIAQYTFRYRDENDKKRYFYLDFYLPEYNLDLEIDGKFHNKEPQLSRDKHRDEIVSKEMCIYRFQWAEPGTTPFQKRLEDFKTFLVEISATKNGI